MVVFPIFKGQHHNFTPIYMVFSTWQMLNKPSKWKVLIEPELINSFVILQLTIWNTIIKGKGFQKIIKFLTTITQYKVFFRDTFFPHCISVLTQFEFLIKLHHPLSIGYKTVQPRWLTDKVRDTTFKLYIV